MRGRLLRSSITAAAIARADFIQIVAKPILCVASPAAAQARGPSSGSQIAADRTDFNHRKAPFIALSKPVQELPFHRRAFQSLARREVIAQPAFAPSGKSPVKRSVRLVRAAIQKDAIGQYNGYAPTKIGRRGRCSVMFGPKTLICNLSCFVVTFISADCRIETLREISHGSCVQSLCSCVHRVVTHR